MLIKTLISKSKMDSKFNYKRNVVNCPEHETSKHKSIDEEIGEDWRFI